MDRRGLKALQLQSEGDVARDIHVREQRIVLEHDVDVALVRRQVSHVLAGQQNASRIRDLEAAEHAQRGRLAAAGRPEERDELAGLDGEVEIVDGHSLAVGLGDVLEVNDRLHQRLLARRVKYSA